MRYYLSPHAVLRHLEVLAVYQIKRDELYELDEASYEFLRTCATGGGCETKDSAFIDYCLEEGIVTTERVDIKRTPLMPAPEPSLRYLELQITNYCNLKCRHCYIEEAPRRELSPEQVRDVLRTFEEMQGLRVMITGGEPLIHTRFDEINSMLPDFSLRKVLFTNGLLLNENILNTLNVHEIQISIDGLEQAHDALRGQGMFARAMNAVKMSLDAGFDVSIATMAHRLNMRDFDEMERMFRDMGIKDWTVDIPCNVGRLKENGDLRLSPVEGGRYLSYGYGGGIHAAAGGYGCGLHLMAVLSDGRTAKCTFYADEGQSAGSISEGLRTCWERIRPIRLSSLECDCEYLNVCRGGCRYRAELISGKGGKDLYRCALYGII